MLFQFLLQQSSNKDPAIWKRFLQAFLILFRMKVCHNKGNNYLHYFEALIALFQKQNYGEQLAVYFGNPLQIVSAFVSKNY